MIMKGNIVTILFLAMGLMLSPLSANALPPVGVTLQFDFEGMGNAMLASPPEYEGDIIAGDALVLGGTWWIRIDDSTWPPSSTPQARWDYLFNNFATFDPLAHAWTIVLDEHSCATKPVWRIDHPVNGMMTGTLVVVVSYSDWDVDGVLDLDERMFGMFSGTLLVMKYGTGEFAGYCGNGAYNGSLTNDDPANWANDFVEGSCLLNLENCQVGTRETTWTAIKSIFK